MFADATHQEEKLMTEPTVRIRLDDAEHTLIRYDLDPAWTLADFEAAYTDAVERINALSHSVYVIVNTGDHIDLPPGFFVAMHRMQRSMPPNTPLCVVVARGPMLEMLFRVFKRFAPIIAATLEITPTLEEAYARIKQHRSQNAANRD